MGNFRNEVIAVNEVYNEISRFHQTFLSCVLRVSKCSTQLGFIPRVDLMFAWVARQCHLRMRYGKLLCVSLEPNCEANFSVV